MQVLPYTQPTGKQLYSLPSSSTVTFVPSTLKYIGLPPSGTSIVLASTLLFPIPSEILLLAYCSPPHQTITIVHLQWFKNINQTDRTHNSQSTKVMDTVPFQSIKTSLIKKFGSIYITYTDSSFSLFGRSYRILFGLIKSFKNFLHFRLASGEYFTDLLAW